jgi:predicted glutamine amidotransferase
MCRLLGFVAHEPVTITSVLDHVLSGIIDISHVHCDGWGMAWYDRGLQHAKAPEAAYASEQYASLVQNVRTDILLSHVRRATPGYELCMENTHPFTYEQMAFAHNGSIVPKEAIEAFIAPHLLPYVTGTTDSERHFFALFSALEHASPIEAIQKHLQTLHQNMQSNSLNFLFMTQDALYAVCDYDPDGPMVQNQADYFHLQYHIAPDAVIIGSTGLNVNLYDGWKTLENGQLLRIERHTLKTTVVNVSQNSRRSLQERDTSLLQR